MRHLFTRLARTTHGGLGRQLVAAVLSGDYRRRMRLLQWLVAGGMYLGSALVLSTGLDDGWIDARLFVGWVVFVTLGTVLAFLAIRSGWSERLADPALTDLQIVMGCIAVDWGYLMCGPLRSIALFPLAIILTFGAFSLSWRRIMLLTAFALASLLATVALIWAYPSLQGPWPASRPPLDRVNVLMMLVLMPALAVITARLSSMRVRLKEHSHRLSDELQSAKRIAGADELTNLPNRRTLGERLERLYHEAIDSDSPFVVVMLDLDRFKEINDSLGHAEGDALLQEFARAAMRSTRTRDIVGRWGGEEFLLLLPGTDIETARSVVERLQEHVAVIRTGGGVTFSAGLALHRCGEAPLDTVARADAAMYDAKGRGRNCIVVADAPLDAR